VPAGPVSITLLVSVLWLALVAWLIARAFGQRNALLALAPVEAPKDLPGGVRSEATDDVPSIAVIVPARDEAHNIAPCLRSLFAQRYPVDRVRFIVVDDDSSDDTADIVTALAAENPSISLVRAPPLPPGWKGKVHACCVGAAAAGKPDWLCFLDADMRAAPALLASAVQAARTGGLDLLTLAPRQRLETFAERLILPCGLIALGFSQDLVRIQAPQSGDAVATGQFMLLKRESYERVGGFAAVRAEICEDVEIARLLKRRGHRVLMQDGTRLLETRMYTGWRTLWPGFAKNLIVMVGGPTRTLALAGTAVVLGWAAVLVPAYDASACLAGGRGACAALIPALAASCAAFALHVAAAAHFGIPQVYGLIFPLGYTVGAMIAVDSVRWRAIGRVRWKGRTYEKGGA
jgi:chlorobactene glucosyltransferase